MAYYLRTTANDWDLEAIIRGWGGGGGGSSSYEPLPPPPLLGLDGVEFEAEAERGVVNELEELYKPFVAQVEQAKQHESPRSSQTETASPCSSSFVVFDHDEDVEKPKEEMKGLVDLEAQARSSCKRRKSKQRIVRVVHRGVGEDGVLLDKWNWRKYGQKAIKGSPHPRSYYRCSSSGGCHARKHVEQSKDDPETCIVTYIADHSHSPPTRRHAQAGRKITKFSSSTNRVTKNTNKTPPCSTSTITWTAEEPLILEGGDQVALGEGFVEDECCGIGVMKDLFSTTSSVSLDHDWSVNQDWSVWEFDPFFSTSIC